jgi:hypothetical protein
VGRYVCGYVAEIPTAGTLPSQYQSHKAGVPYHGTVPFSVEVEVDLRSTVSRPVCHGVGLPSGAHDQIFVFCLTIAGFLMWGTLSDERMGL